MPPPVGSILILPTNSDTANPTPPRIYHIKLIILLQERIRELTRCVFV